MRAHSALTARRRAAEAPPDARRLRAQAARRPQLVKGSMQLYSVEQQRSQALEAHAAAFTVLKLPGKDAASPVISFAQKTLGAGGVITSKLHVIELGAPGAANLKKAAELFFPPEFADDFPVSMQIRCPPCGAACGGGGAGRGGRGGAAGGAAGTCVAEAARHARL